MATAMADCFSMILPSGERFFIRSLKRCEQDIHDPTLKQAIKEFSAQEAFHSREHEGYNRGLIALGHDVETTEKETERCLNAPRSKVIAVAATCAIEHFTTTFANFALSNIHLFDSAPDHYRRLWVWHSVEEIEHTAVAFDVYNEITRNLSPWKRYAARVGAMIGVVHFMVRVIWPAVFAYCRAEGEEDGFRLKLRFIRTMFGRPGLIIRNLWPTLRYFSPWFKPAKDVDQTMVERFRQEVDADMAAA